MTDCHCECKRGHWECSEISLPKWKTLKPSAESRKGPQTPIVNATPFPIRIFGRGSVLQKDDPDQINSWGQCWQLLEVHKSVGCLWLDRDPPFGLGQPKPKEPETIGPRELQVFPADTWNTEVLCHGPIVLCGLRPIAKAKAEDLLGRPGMLVVTHEIAHFLKHASNGPHLKRPVYVQCTDYFKGVWIERRMIGTTAFEVYP